MPVLVEARLRRPLLGVVGAVAAAVLTVSGCAAGQDAQTVEQTSVVDGTAFQAGAIALRDVGLRAPSGTSYAEGATAYLEGLMVNQNSQTDQLLSVSSPIADKVVLYSDGVSAVLGEQPSASASSSASGSASSTETASPSDGATPTTGATPTDSTSATASASASGSTSSSAGASSSAAAAPTPISELDLPTNQAISFGYDNQQLAIAFVGLKQQLFPSNVFQVTFTFAKAGSVTKTLFVKLPVDSTIDAPTINTEEQEGGGE